MRTLNAKDIEALENTTVATPLLATGATDQIALADCGAQTWWGCVAASCVQDSHCHADSNCDDGSCDAATCAVASCLQDSGCAEDSGCGNVSGCDNLSLCDGQSLPPQTAHTGDIDLASLLRQAILET